MAANQPKETQKKRRLLGRFTLWPKVKRFLPRVILAVIGLCALYFALIVFLLALYRAPGIHPYSTLMMADVVTRQEFEREWVPIDRMGTWLPYSVIMSEDGQFCSHRGVDFAALKLIVDRALEGESTRGASTLTMQLAKNLFLWQGRSYVRKGVEIPIAIVIDLMLPKWRQMEIYLNIAEWGDGIYGAGAGAKKHFGRTPKNLTRKQAALMTVTLPNPYLRNPRKPSRGLARLGRVIENRAKQSGAYVQCLKRG